MPLSIGKKQTKLTLDAPTVAVVVFDEVCKRFGKTRNEMFLGLVEAVWNAELTDSLPAKQRPNAQLDPDRGKGI